MFQEKFGDGGICGMHVVQKMVKQCLVRLPYTVAISTLRPTFVAMYRLYRSVQELNDHFTILKET